MTRQRSFTSASYYARARRQEEAVRRHMYDARVSADRREQMLSLGREDVAARMQDMVKLCVQFARAANRHARYCRESARFQARMDRQESRRGRFVF